MTFPPPHPASQNSIASGTNKTISARPPRSQQSPWGLPGQTSGLRRGLTPLSTNVGSSLTDPSSRRPGTSGSPSNTSTTSPFASTFPSLLSSTTRASNSRNNSSASLSASPFPAQQTGSQQLHANQLLSSPRFRSNTPSTSSYLTSSAAGSTTVAQGGGGGGSGGGGSSRSNTFSPPLSQQGIVSPTNTTFDRAVLAPTSSTSVSNSQTSVSKIVVTQIFILLGSITEKEGKTKWDSQAEAIRKVCHDTTCSLRHPLVLVPFNDIKHWLIRPQLVDSHGMEVFAKYFRRLLVGNAPQIFTGIGRNVENPGNYQLLVQEMQKITQDPEQAQKIAETIDTSEGDSLRDFDLSTFMDHFKLDPLSKTLLALAFKQASKADLRTKGMSTVVLLITSHAKVDSGCYPLQ